MQGRPGGKKLAGVGRNKGETEIGKPRRRCKTDNKKVLIEVGASIRTSIGREALYQSTINYSIAPPGRKGKRIYQHE